MSYQPKPTVDRILARLDAQGPCWLWLGYVTRSGYGQVRDGGANGKTRPVHRVLWEALVGPIPPGLQLDHLCKVPRCCNPDHLEPVTPKENTRRSGAGILTGSRQRAKTHCPSGHPYDEANTSHGARGRTCRACARQRYHSRKGIAA